MSRLDNLPSRTGHTEDSKFKVGLVNAKHTYSFPTNFDKQLTPHMKALLDYWEFIDLINYQGGRENFASIHREMVEFLTEPQVVFVPEEEKVYRRLMMIPRGHLKTTLVVAYVLWRLYRNPNIRIMVATATKDLALQIVKQCKQLLEDEDLGKRVWNVRPHVDGNMIPSMDRGQSYRRRRQAREALIEDNTDTQAEDKKIVWRADALQVVRDGIFKEPSLMGTSTGSNTTGMHFDLIVMDDIINDDTCATPEKMEKTQEWAGDIESIIDPPRSVVMGQIGDLALREFIGDEEIIIGTRYAKGDYYEYILNDAERLEYKVFEKNIYNNGINDSDGYIWEEKFNKQYVERLKKRLTTRRFGSQYLNTIITAEEQILDQENCQYFSSAKVAMIDRKARIFLAGEVGVDVSPVLVVDPAISEKKTADYTVILVGGLDYERNLYILDFFCGRVPPTKLVEQLFSLAEKWEIKMAHIEAVAYQKALIPMIKSKFNEYKPISISEYLPRGDKKSRIETHLEPLFTNRKVFFSGWMANHAELQEEIYYFPAQNVHDDILDAMTMLCEIANPTRDKNKKKRKARVFGKYNQKYGGIY